MSKLLIFKWKKKFLNLAFKVTFATANSVSITAATYLALQQIAVMCMKDEKCLAENYDA